ncbi:hypothetical protein JB92DRAFT_1647965 [Gautieria morchelliformis]|nr:hypothetical protein JB92DRAFT_1647965 [Gautieria morchelliformis]
MSARPRRDGASIFPRSVGARHLPPSTRACWRAHACGQWPISGKYFPSRDGAKRHERTHSQSGLSWPNPTIHNDRVVACLNSNSALLTTNSLRGIGGPRPLFLRYIGHIIVALNALSEQKKYQGSLYKTCRDSWQQSIILSLHVHDSPVNPATSSTIHRSPPPHLYRPRNPRLHPHFQSFPCEFLHTVHARRLVPGDMLTRPRVAWRTV